MLHVVGILVTLSCVFHCTRSDCVFESGSIHCIFPRDGTPSSGKKVSTMCIQYNDSI